MADVGNKYDTSSTDTNLSSESTPSTPCEHHAIIPDSLTPMSTKDSSEALYAGATITVRQFHVTIASMALRHNLTYACQSDLLRFMTTILLAPNSVTTASRSLTRKFVRYEQQSLIHRCCGTCMYPIPDGERCSRSQCVDQGVPDALFVEVPLDKQLQERFKGKC